MACRYGPDARQAAGDVSTAAIEGSAAYYNMTRMGVRTVAKRIAKRTAKGLVKNTVLTGRASLGMWGVDITSAVARGPYVTVVAGSLVCYKCATPGLVDDTVLTGGASICQSLSPSLHNQLVPRCG